MTNEIETLVCLCKSAHKVTIAGRRHIAKQADDADKELLKLKGRLARMEKALRLIKRSDTFNGGTFVKELQQIAREGLGEGVAKTILPV